MAPDTADLIEEIDSERERVTRVLEVTEEQIKEWNELSERIANDMSTSRESLSQAIEALRRAGLLKTKR